MGLPEDQLRGGGNEASTMTGFPIACRFQVFLFPRTHIGRPALNGAYQIRDEIKAGGGIVNLRTCGDEPPAGDFRFRQMGLLRLGIQLPGQVVGDAQNQYLHGVFVLHEVKPGHTENNSSQVDLNFGNMVVLDLVHLDPLEAG